MQQTKFHHRNFDMYNCENKKYIQDQELSEFVAFRISENLLQQLKQKAEQEGTDLSHIIREYLKKCL